MLDTDALSGHVPGEQSAIEASTRPPVLPAERVMHGSTQVIHFSGETASAEEMQPLVISGRRLLKSSSVVAAMDVLARGEHLIAVVRSDDTILQELAALARIPALARSVAIIKVSERETSWESESVGEPTAVLVAATPASLTNTIAECERRLRDAAGVLQIGCTSLLYTENTIRTGSGELRVQPSTASLLEALMRAYPDPVAHQSLQTDVVRFAPDAQSGAVHTRIYQLRRALREVGADISVEFVEGRGYKLKEHCTGGG